MGIMGWTARTEHNRNMERALGASIWESLQRDALKEWEEKLRTEMEKAKKEYWPTVREINPLEHEGMK